MSGGGDFWISFTRRESSDRLLSSDCQGFFARLAARRNKNTVEMNDLDKVIERVVAGSEQRTRAMNEQEKRAVAVHEAGHALVASLLPGTDTVHKVTIVPHGQALGVAFSLPESDTYSRSQAWLTDRIDSLIKRARSIRAPIRDSIMNGADDDGSGTVVMLEIASAVKMITTPSMIVANERATRSRRLKVIAYSNKEKAVIAMPAVRIWLTVFRMPIRLSCQGIPIRKSYRK